MRRTPLENVHAAERSRLREILTSDRAPPLLNVRRSCSGFAGETRDLVYVGSCVLCQGSVRSVRELWRISERPKRMRFPFSLLIVSLFASACGSAGSGGSAPSSTQESVPPAAPETTVDSISVSRNGGDTAGSSTSTASSTVVPFDCSVVVEGSTLLSEDPAPIELLESQLELMKEIQSDAILIWEEFGIQPDFLMVDGFPRILIGSDDAGTRCDAIVAAVEHPNLVQVVRWTEEDYGSLHEQGSPPWRRLIESEIGSPFDDEAARRYTSMGTGIHGIAGITLNGGEEALAAELTEKYGPLVELRVGNFAYDPEADATVGAEMCDQLPDDTARTQLSIDGGRLVADLDGGHVLFDLANAGTSTVHIVPERIAELTRVDETDTVTAFAGAMTAEARPSIAVAPGATETVRGDISSVSCDRSAGTALPPGAYDATLVIRVFEQPASEGEPSAEILVARLPIEIP